MKTTTKKATTVRLSADAQTLLGLMSLQGGISKAACLETCIREAARSRNIKLIGTI